MPFPWSEVGAPPASDVPEISVFGPGYGESVVVHIGDGRWTIVDSCVESGTGLPVALTYLERLGFDPATAVDLVVASHWHDDHVRGLGEVVKRCRSAVFVCASVLTRKEFYDFVDGYEAGNVAVSGSGTSEFRHIQQIL